MEATTSLSIDCSSILIRVSKIPSSFFSQDFYLEVRVRATLRGRGTGVRSGGCREQPVFLGAF